MTNLPFSSRQISMAIGSLALSINVFLMISYLFIGYEEHLHSDSAVRLLLAEEIIRTGELFPSTWYFVNGDIWLLSAHWFALPIIAVAPISPFVHALAGLMSTSVLAVSLWTLLVALNTSISSRIWLMALVFSGISGLVAEGLFGQASYSMVFAAMLLLLAAVIRILEDGQATRRWLALVVLVISLQIATNPLRGIVFCVLPLALAVTFTSWKSCSKQQLGISTGGSRARSISIDKCLRLTGLMLAGVFSGVILRAILVPGLLQIPGVMSDYLQTNTLHELPSTFSLLLRGLLASLGSRPSAGPVLSPEGIYHLFRLLLAIIAISLAVRAVLSGLADSRPSRCLLTVFSAASFLLIGFICIGTNLISLSPDLEGIRYLLPAIVLLLILATINSPDWLKSPVRSSCGLFLILGFTASGYWNLFMVDVSSKWQAQEQDAYAWQSRELVSILREQGLEYGYASYWLANSTTVLSDGAVRVRPILLEGGLPVPRLWLSSSHWYSYSAWSGETFLALTSEEAELVAKDWLEQGAFKPSRVVRTRGFEIWVFPVNLSAIFSWDS